MGTNYESEFAGIMEARVMRIFPEAQRYYEHFGRKVVSFVLYYKPGEGVDRDAFRAASRIRLADLMALRDVLGADADITIGLEDAISPDMLGYSKDDHVTPLFRYRVNAANVAFTLPPEPETAEPDTDASGPDGSDGGPGFPYTDGPVKTTVEIDPTGGSDEEAGSDADTAMASMPMGSFG